VRAAPRNRYLSKRGQAKTTSETVLSMCQSQLCFVEDAQKPGPVLSLSFPVIRSDSSWKLVLEGGFSTFETLLASGKAVAQKQINAAERFCRCWGLKQEF